MNRPEALALVTAKVSNTNLVKHMLAAEACMRRLARRHAEDEELWGLAGLLHDLDYDQTVNDFPKHGFITAEILTPLGIDEQILSAIKGHPGHIERDSPMAKALYAVDPLTGLIVAATLMHPTKKIANVDTEFVLRRFKEKRFAAGANRDQIETCKEIGLTLEEFIQLCLEAMQGIAPDLGL
jgi:putative nucleotidyltransferase with HDIG domain